MPTASDRAIFLAEDLEHQQLRVLLLIAAVARVPGTANKLDGLTKLAKLDFLARYADAEERVGAALDRPKAEPEEPVLMTSAPMIRYRYGPWDDKYHAVIGGLVGRGLVKFDRGRRGSVAMALTAHGRSVAEQLSVAASWEPVARRYESIANRFGDLTGNALKEAVYRALPELTDMPLRSELR